MKLFVFDSRGSVYTHTIGDNSFTNLADVGATTGKGNGMAFYDKYMYFATDTDITRYGPLDGSATPGWEENFWQDILPMTSLTSHSYPYALLASGTSAQLPNHYLHPHSDGRLYIADALSSQGFIHYIKTTGGVAGSSSAYQALTLPTGLVPICMESLGANLVIAAYEQSQAASSTNFGLRSKTGRAKIAFWDTLSQNINAITWVEFPDGLITAMKNVNGTLYVFSAPAEKTAGLRISKYIGGNTFDDVWSSEEALAPFPGAVDGTANRLVFGSYTTIPASSGCVYSLGLASSGLSNGGFCPFVSSTQDNAMVTALILPANSGRGKGWDYPVFGSSDFSSTFRLENIDGSSNCNSMWWSSVFRVGQRYKITKIRVPIAEPLTAGTTVIPKIYTDDGFGTAYTLTSLTSANFGTTKRNIVIHPVNLTGESNFWLELKWSTSYPLVVGLPITIEYELINDD
jgi:hypothetical protein